MISKNFFVASIIIYLFVMIGCSSTSMNYMGKRIQAAGTGGFVSEIDEPSSRGNLKRVSADGNDVRGRLCISPDRKYILYPGVQGKYSTYGNGSNSIIQVWRMPIKGGAPVKITSGGYNSCEYPAYTPDGKQIVYSSGGTLWRINVNGSGPRTRIPGSGLGSDFAPNIAHNGRIVFCSYEKISTGTSVNEKYFIWMCDKNGQNLTQLREGFLPMWSPDAKQIVFVHEGDIWLINTDGTELTQLTSTPGIYEGIPSFNDDGSKIIFVSNAGRDGLPMKDDFNIWQMDRNGTNTRQITELSSWDSWPLTIDGGLYFISARAATDGQNKLQRIWMMRLE